MERTLGGEQTGISKSTVARAISHCGSSRTAARTPSSPPTPSTPRRCATWSGSISIRRTRRWCAGVDEKSQVQALERTQPVLPIGLGYLEGVTHDYYRHGTTTLFAALNVLDGSVISQCSRHRHQEFLAFLKHLDHNVPDDLEVHLIADNYATHKHPRVKPGSLTVLAITCIHPTMRAGQPGRALRLRDHPAGNPAWAPAARMGTGSTNT